MAVLPLVYFPDDPLTRPASPVETFDAQLEQVAIDMLETMHAYEGVGLAAPQIGLPKRFFVLQQPGGPEMCLVNPVLADLEGREFGEEGCLSMPQVYAQVPRATRLKVRAQDLAGNPIEFEAVEFLARILQHECDHLDGILFPQRLDIISRQNALDEWAELRERLLNDLSSSR